MRMNKGIWYALGAYAIWGLFPLYWKALGAVPPTQVVCHRIVWSVALLFTLLFVLRQWRLLLAAVRGPQTARVMGAYLLAAVLIAVNWLLYIWAVNAGHIVEASLGYFINPLVNVLLGVVFLRERLRPWQWLPIACAAAGVLCVTIAFGAPPWIALALAVTFGLYGLIKKVAPLGAVHGLALETALLFLPALAYLLWCEHTGSGAITQGGTLRSVLLAGAGVVTTTPLLLFAAAARRIPLTLLGVLQYISPTLQFLLGVLVFHEPFSGAQIWGFVLVWIGLLIFAVESYLAYRAQLATPAVHEHIV